MTAESVCWIEIWINFSNVTLPGIPASFKRSTKTMHAVGSRSDGFMMYVFPQIVPTGNIHNGIIAGKLKGAIPAQTPIGVLYDTVKKFWAWHSFDYLDFKII